MKYYLYEIVFEKDDYPEEMGCCRRIIIQSPHEPDYKDIGRLCDIYAEMEIGSTIELFEYELKGSYDRLSHVPTDIDLFTIDIEGFELYLKFVKGTEVVKRYKI